jgi:hypothetical protein
MGASRQITIRPNQLNWNTLSTFYALCGRTGEQLHPGDERRQWASLIVMTTCDSVRRQGKKTAQDKTYAYKGWCSVPRTLWLRMAGSSGYSLLDPSPAPALVPAAGRPPVLVDEEDEEEKDDEAAPIVAPGGGLGHTRLTQNELRARRAAFFAPKA